jgi:hypothetical protein
MNTFEWVFDINEDYDYPNDPTASLPCTWVTMTKIPHIFIYRHSITAEDIIHGSQMLEYVSY